MTIIMERSALQAFLRNDFPEVAEDFVVDEAAEAGVRLRLRVGARHLRPGGTVSGPAIFGLADIGVYLTILSRIGPEALAVTTTASIDFLRKPAAGRDLVAACRLIKLGRVLAVGVAEIRDAGAPDGPLLAQATVTYSRPPRRDT